MRRKRFSESELKALHRAVQEAEQKTGVEIVPMVVARSAAYFGFHLTLALCGLGVAAGIAFVVSKSHPWWGMEELLALEVAGFALGFLVSEIPFVFRLCLSSSALRREVRQAAAAQLVLLGRSDIRGEKGKVLIFISLLERRVQLLAEQPVRAKVAPDFWRGQAEQIAKGVIAGTGADAVEKAISSCANALS